MASLAAIILNVRTVFVSTEDDVRTQQRRCASVLVVLLERGVKTI